MAPATPAHQHDLCRLWHGSAIQVQPLVLLAVAGVQAGMFHHWQLSQLPPMPLRLLLHLLPLMLLHLLLLACFSVLRSQQQPLAKHCWSLKQVPLTGCPPPAAHCTPCCICPTTLLRRRPAARLLRLPGSVAWAANVCLGLAGQQDGDGAVKGIVQAVVVVHVCIEQVGGAQHRGVHCSKYTRSGNQAISEALLSVPQQHQQLQAMRSLTQAPAGSPDRQQQFLQALRACVLLPGHAVRGKCDLEGGATQVQRAQRAPPWTLQLPCANT